MLSQPVLLQRIISGLVALKQQVYFNKKNYSTKLKKSFKNIFLPLITHFKLETFFAFYYVWDWVFFCNLGGQKLSIFLPLSPSAGFHV